MLWIIADEIYAYLDRENILPEEQKGCRKGSRGTKDQLLIDKVVLKDCKKRHTNIAMTWIDYKKAYDMVPPSWICTVSAWSCLVAMANWKLELTSCGQALGDVDVRRGIFQGVCCWDLTLLAHCCRPFSDCVCFVSATFQILFRYQIFLAGNNNLLFLKKIVIS